MPLSGENSISEGVLNASFALLKLFSVTSKYNLKVVNLVTLSANKNVLLTVLISYLIKETKAIRAQVQTFLFKDPLRSSLNYFKSVPSVLLFIIIFLGKNQKRVLFSRP